MVKSVWVVRRLVVAGYVTDVGCINGLLIWVTARMRYAI